ncbi:unnamed protein product [Parnassius apollo]|uniref:(apollo) hypothetical protein n=1 Tax=Parnassius apollo TaxID=110799 RepID=A0A8S3Y6X1_PARAO|nr:unnamed protein product [Parnassius apollo]
MDGIIEEDFLAVITMKGHTRGCDFMEALKEFVEKSCLATTTDENFGKNENAPEECFGEVNQIKKSLLLCSESISSIREVEGDSMDMEVNAQDDLGTQKLRSPPIDMLTHKHVVRSVEELEDYSAPCEVDTAESSEKTYQLEGRRILNLKTFYSKLQEVFAWTFQLWSRDEGSEMNINNCAVLGTVAIGCDHSQLQELSASLDLPSISFNMYQKCHENISNIWEGISLKTMTDAAKEEREFALLQGRIDENGVPIIDVIVDDNELQEDAVQEKKENDKEKEIELRKEKEVEEKNEDNENEEEKKEDFVGLSKFPNVNICEHGEISEDKEVQPTKRIKILGERNLNFSEF